MATKLREALIGIPVAIIITVMHSAVWIVYGGTFISKVLLLTLMLISCWPAARLLRPYLTRISNTSNLIAHLFITALLISWIPPLLIMGINRYLADKSIYEVTLPVVKRGYERSSRSSSATGTAYVKVTRNWYTKSFYVRPGTVELEKIDSLKLQLSKGYLGFEVIKDYEYIAH